MQINYATAKKLCTAAEMQLLERVKPVALATLPAARAKVLLGNARRHADKWRQQAIKQGQSTDGSAARSRAKQELFEEAVARLNARIEKLGKPAPAAKTAAKTVTVSKKTARKRAVPKPRSKKQARKKATPTPGKISKPNPRAQIRRKAASKSKKLMTSGITTRRKAHTKSMGKRNQAARSSRKRS